MGSYTEIFSMKGVSLSIFFLPFLLACWSQEAKGARNVLGSRLEVYSVDPLTGWFRCAARWREAMNAGAAPLVNLQATHVKALHTVTLEQLNNYQAYNYDSCLK